MAVKVRIWYDTQAGCYTVSSPYNAKFLETLKQIIPSGDRVFDPATKFWHYPEKYGAGIQQAAQAIFGIHNVSFTSRQVAEQSQQTHRAPTLSRNSGTIEDDVIGFAELVGYEAMKSAYRRGAMELHPDRQQNDASKMTKLNELWSRIEKELFKK